MTERIMDENLRRSKLKQERAEALGKLDKVLGRVQDKETYAKIGLADAVATRYVAEVANYRAGVKALLRKRLEDTSNEGDTNERQLAHDILDAIERVELIDEKLKKKPEPERDPEPNGSSPSSSSGQEPAANAA